MDDGGDRRRYRTIFDSESWSEFGVGSFDLGVNGIETEEEVGPLFECSGGGEVRSKEETRERESLFVRAMVTLQRCFAWVWEGRWP